MRLNIDLLAEAASGSIPVAGAVIAPILASVFRDGPTWTFKASKADGSKEWDVDIYANARVDLNSVGSQRVAVLHGEGKVLVDVRRIVVVRGEINVFRFGARLE